MCGQCILYYNVRPMRALAFYVMGYKKIPCVMEEKRVVNSIFLISYKL